MGTVISLLAQNCRRASHSLRDKSTAAGARINIDRSVLAPYFSTPAQEHGEYVIIPASGSSEYPSAPSIETASTYLRVFRFPKSTLDLLKGYYRTERDRASIISHNILTALLYATVCTARSIRLHNSNPSGTDPGIAEASRISITIDSRGRLRLPLDAFFIGNLVVGATFCIPFPIII